MLIGRYEFIFSNFEKYIYIYSLGTILHSFFFSLNMVSDVLSWHNSPIHLLECGTLLMGGTSLPSNLGAYGHAMNINYKYFLVFVSMTDLLCFIYLGFFFCKSRTARLKMQKGLLVNVWLLKLSYTWSLSPTTYSQVASNMVLNLFLSFINQVIIIPSLSIVTRINNKIKDIKPIIDPN